MIGSESWGNDGNAAKRRQRGQHGNEVGINNSGHRVGEQSRNVEGSASVRDEQPGGHEECAEKGVRKGGQAKQPSSTDTCALASSANPPPTLKILF